MNSTQRRPFLRLLLLVGFVVLSGPLAAQNIALPAPRGDDIAITRILAARHDTTAFSPAGLSQQNVSDLLWASTGINRPTTGGRTSNYSRVSRDNEIYLLCAEGVFLYDQLEHLLTHRSTTDLRSSLGGAAATAPLTLVLVTYSNSTDFFGSIHTGFIAENVALACADRGLGSQLSANIPGTLAAALGLASGRTILFLQTVGQPEGTTAADPAWTVTAGALIPAAVNVSPALQILKRRRSTRNFAATAFSTQTLAELAWAALGINNSDTGERTSPLVVAAAHDIDLYMALAGGVYVYRAGASHHLEQISTTDIRGNLGFASVPAIFIYVSDYTKLAGVTNKARATALHAGLVSQNVAVYATAEGLGELVRSSVTYPKDFTDRLTADQRILFTQTLGYMANPPGASRVTVSAGTGGTVTNGSVTPAPNQNIAFGATGTPLTAVPAVGYTFTYWNGLPGGRVTANPLALPNVTCPMDIAAVFTADPVTYSTWRIATFGPDAANDAIAGPSADPDAAGVTNLQRYAFNLPARGPVATPTTLGSTEISGQKYLTITFPRRTVASDLSYSVESSPDLITWTPVTGLIYAPGTDPITAQDAVAMGTTTRRFLRVRVQAQP